MANHAVTPEAMERYPRTMLDELMKLALLHGLPERVHPGSTALTAVTRRMVEQRSALAAAAHPMHLWFRPLSARRLAAPVELTSANASGCYYGR
jgi:hypothetical protein